MYYKWKSQYMGQLPAWGRSELAKCFILVTVCNDATPQMVFKLVYNDLLKSGEASGAALRGYDCGFGNSCRNILKPRLCTHLPNGVLCLEQI